MVLNITDKSIQVYAALQSQKVVTACLYSKQLLPIGFVGQYYKLPIVTVFTLYPYTHRMRFNVIYV